jgi:hypothetical protein
VCPMPRDPPAGFGVARAGGVAFGPAPAGPYT